MKAVECCLNGPIYFANWHRTWLMLTYSSGEIKIDSIQLYFLFLFYKEVGIFCEVKKKENAGFSNWEMTQILLDSQHLVSLKSVLNRKKIEIIPEGASLMLVGKWRGWHVRSFPWLKIFHFHIPLPQIEHLSLFSFCSWLCSVPNLKEKKMLEFYFPCYRCQVKVLKSSQLFVKLPLKATIGKRTVYSHEGIGWSPYL